MQESNIQNNIMYIFNDMGFGGAGQSLLDILFEIKQKINPIVVIRDDAKAVEDKLCELRIRYYKIHFVTDYVKIGSADEEQRQRDIKQNYEAALQLLPIIQDEHIQLIHINSSVSSFAAIAALITHIPYIWHVRELLEEQYGYQFINERLKISLYKKASKMITISDYVKMQYYKKYGLETCRLYNGLNIGRFKKDITKKVIQFKNVFIVAAMITPEKGQWDVIQATEILVQKGYIDIQVIIVGNGALNYVWALKKYIKKKKLENNIKILSFQDDLSSLRDQASYAITCSQNEALGRVTIEAMLAGNIVIGARSGGTTEIIGENETRGFLYELGNSMSLANAMERAINYEIEKKKLLLQTAQRYAEGTFNSKHYCRKLLEIYDNLISSFKIYKYDNFLEEIKNYYYSIKDLVGFENKAVTYNKSTMISEVALKWLEIRQRSHNISEYFKEHNLQQIAIYGMGILGCRLYDELEDSGIQVKNMIDKSPNGMDKIFTFSLLNEEKLFVDMIVVTVISSEEQIISEIKSYGYKNVIGLSEIINSFDNKI